MHLKLSVSLVVLLAWACHSALAQQQQQQKVNVVLGESCWTSGVCREEFK